MEENEEIFEKKKNFFVTFSIELLLDYTLIRNMASLRCLAFEGPLQLLKCSLFVHLFSLPI